MPILTSPTPNTSISRVLFACLALLLLQTPLPLSQAFAQVPARTRPKASPKNLKMHLKQWFKGLQARVKKLQGDIAKADKTKRFGLIMKLAGEYERIIRVQSLLARRYETYRNSSMWQKLQPLQQEATKQSLLFRVQAAQLYQMLLSQYPGDLRLCKVYHGLGKHLTRLGKQKVAAQIYQSLLQAFAKKPCAHKADAHLSLGERFYEAGKLKQAMAQYQKVLQQGDTKIRAFALYKLAWSYFNLRRYTQSLGHFVETLQYLQRAPAAGHPPQAEAQALRKKTRHDLLLAYAEVGVAKTAGAFFRKIEPLHAQNMLYLLAGVYKTQRKYKRAAELYSVLIAEARNAAEALEAWAKALHLQKYISPKHKNVAFKRARVLRALLRKHNATDNTPAFKKVAQKLSVKWIKWGIKKHKLKAYKSALAWYNLAALLLHNRGSGLWFWRAEVHMALRNYDNAASDYSRYSRLLPKGKHAKNAAYNAVLAHDTGLKAGGETGPIRRKPDQIHLVSPTIHMGGIFRAIDDFIKRYPKDPRVQAIRYRYAYYAYRFDNTKTIIDTFEKMMAAHPKHPFNPHVATLIVRSLQRRKRQTQLKKWRDALGKRYPSPALLRHVDAQIKATQPTSRPTSRPASRPDIRRRARPTSRPTSRPGLRLRARPTPQQR